ncbi:hypothetical protein PFISCL1PPCAC_2049, partial [Pristionchus fissidentatus]
LTRSIFGLLASKGVRRCPFSATAAQSAASDDSPPPLLPSRDFLKNNVRTAPEKERLTSAISEIEMYKEFHGSDSIPSLSDKQWESLLTIKYPDERCNFLAALHFDSENGSNEGGMRSMEVREPSDSQMFDIRGQDLRKLMDSVYGSRLWSRERCGSEDLPRLVVDARFLAEFSTKTQPVYTRSVQDLNDSNWSSPHPFHISIANFRPDAQLSELTKRHWHFLYGPPSDSINAPSFRIHPFAPTVSPRPVRSLLNGIDKNDIIYVSQRAQQFLPEKPPKNVKALVVCLSGDNHHSSSSATAAIAERITAYRIPIEKHLDLSSCSRSPPIWETVSALRRWWMGEEWRDAIKKSIVPRRKKTKSVEETMKTNTFLAFRSAVMEMNNARLERQRRGEGERGRRDGRMERREGGGMKREKRRRSQ